MTDQIPGCGWTADMPNYSEWPEPTLENDTPCVARDGYRPAHSYFGEEGEPEWTVGQARKTLTPGSLDARMDGIAWNRDADALLDEHPEAYKDLGAVMEAQSDLVKIKHRLTTILNYKGT